MEDDRKVISISKACSWFVLIGPAKNFENRLTDKVLMAKMNLNREFALAREITHDHKNG